MGWEVMEVTPPLWERVTRFARGLLPTTTSAGEERGVLLDLSSVFQSAGAGGMRGSPWLGHALHDVLSWAWAQSEAPHTRVIITLTSRLGLWDIKEALFRRSATSLVSSEAMQEGGETPGALEILDRQLCVVEVLAGPEASLLTAKGTEEGDEEEETEGVDQDEAPSALVESLINDEVGPSPRWRNPVWSVRLKINCLLTHRRSGC
jgi:hypothetical protein